MFKIKVLAFAESFCETAIFTNNKVIIIIKKASRIEI